MKLVAIRDLANVPKIGITVNPKSKGYKHPNQIHKGYRFTFGSSNVFDELTPDEKEVVALLVTSNGAVIDDGSETSIAAIAKIEAEIAEDKVREKRDRKCIKREENKLTFDRRLAIWGIIVGLLAIAVALYIAL